MSLLYFKVKDQKTPVKIYFKQINNILFQPMISDSKIPLLLTENQMLLTIKNLNKIRNKLNNTPLPYYYIYNIVAGASKISMNTTESK